MSAALAWAETRLGHRFADTSLLDRALTHKSLGGINYERLEFLGDRVLGAVMAAWLYQRFPDESEGQLTRRFATLVSRETCATVARALDVPAYVRLGTQARADGGSDSDNILGDVVEALIGALYCDAGVSVAERFILSAWATLVSAAAGPAKHPKSAIQEWAAAHGARDPLYELLGRFGPHHAPRFRVRLTVSPHPPVEAEGGSKQDAETEAARALMQQVAP
ncbi:ribonuclease III [Sandaracinobacteroides saxicola]|uniref:Ribonuclease 3 n=1 Tax=Sandaracinobacteroides saxicola TaxID=2759707 RepID=A0A7G5IJT8_9SPHN|nr:ribonuclease III [Sandaracinobacteroides saxicola]QMW23630.1 ribonuclease III [Sandaracinobacteroides saxicola]